MSSSRPDPSRPTERPPVQGGAPSGPATATLGPAITVAGESAPQLLARAVDAAWRLDPELGLLLARLAERCEVALVDGVGTARIRRHGAGARIELDPEFLREQLRTDEDLLFLLAHEVMHRVQGDLVRQRGGPQSAVDRLAANLVADVRINGALRGHFFRAPVGLLERSYADASFPGLLLLPPDALLRRAAPPGSRREVLWTELPRHRDALERAARRAFQEAGLSGRLPGRFARWYTKAWLDDVAQPGLIRQLRAALPELPTCAVPLLLGDHDPDDAGSGADRLPPGASDLPPELEALLRALSERLGHGAGGALQEATVELRLQDELAALRRRLRRALTAGVPRTARQADATARQVVPSFARRECYQLAAGMWPGLFTHPARAPGEDPERVEVYLDVSGSLNEHLPRLYALLAGLRDLLAEPCWAFSNEVAPLPLASLSAGRVPTTGGTDFSPVIEHALARRARRVLVATDGLGPLAPALARAARERRLDVHLLLTPDGRQRGELGALARSVERLGRVGLEGA